MTDFATITAAIGAATAGIGLIDKIGDQIVGPVGVNVTGDDHRVGDLSLVQVLEHLQLGILDRHHQH